MTNNFENWLDGVRIDLNEKTKDMMNDDAVAAINKSGREIAEKYNIPVIKSAPVRSDRYGI
jgi:hypothetical protein